LFFGSAHFALTTILILPPVLAGGVPVLLAFLFARRGLSLLTIIGTLFVVTRCRRSSASGHETSFFSIPSEAKNGPQL
jgi:hypothetical protein